MKSTLYFFAALTILSVSCGHPKKELNVMTFNIRYDNPADGNNAWTHRREHVARTIRERDIDIAGLQEVLAGQLKDLKTLLPEYEYFGVGRIDGKEEGEFCPVVYKRDKFKREESGYFWLSETPDAPGVKGWDAACERIVTWVRLSDGDRRSIFFVNTHLDHVGVIARKEGAALLLARIGELHKDAPVILVGDFNAATDNELITDFTRASGTLRLTHAAKTAASTTGTPWTFHAFGSMPEERRTFIDYIFTAPGFETRSHDVVPATAADVYLSDHCAVTARLMY